MEDVASKIEVYNQCLLIIEERIASIHSMLKELDSSSSAETKSSMGDKYETSREMIQLERNKLQIQLEEVAKQKKVFSQIDPNKVHHTVQLGSFIRSSAKNFFISASLGAVTVKKEECICISPVAPLAKQIMEKSAGDTFFFMGKNQEILAVS